MKLVNLLYSEYIGDDQEWIAQNCTFTDINLIVGKNATGKSRTLNVIKGLAGLLSEFDKLIWNEGIYQVDFEHENKFLTYNLEYHNKVITKESLSSNNNILVKRDSNGEGEIFANELKKNIRFKIPLNQIAALVKRDAIQHPFLDDLYNWGSHLIKYDFGTQLGKDHLGLPILLTEENKQIDLDLRQTQRVVEIFTRGIKLFSDKFKKAIINDMISIEYELEDVGIDNIPGISIKSIIQTPLGIYVKEKDRHGRTTQTTMSQGMFRALSVLIQINYSLLAGEPSCILIDDIGEGLDYSRSSLLVSLLIEKIKGSSTQLIMATNDRFIMNNVPLEYWIILERQGGKCIHHNYRNSKKMFDEFELKGLSNFDLFSSDYYLHNSTN